MLRKQIFTLVLAFEMHKFNKKMTWVISDFLRTDRNHLPEGSSNEKLGNKLRSKR